MGQNRPRLHFAADDLWIDRVPADFLVHLKRSVTGMLRRLSKSATTLDQTKDDLARRESELREKMEKLERMIADAPRVAEEMTRQQREELLMRANEGRSRLDVSVALQDKRYGDDAGGARPRGALRKERREGRIVFIVLMIALMVAVIWLVSHLQRV
jgi:hypothetical protein